MEFDQDGVAWSSKTWDLPGESLRLVKARGDVWVCCRCTERFDEDSDEVPIIAFMGDVECDLCVDCFRELLTSGALQICHAHGK